DRRTDRRLRARPGAVRDAVRSQGVRWEVGFAADVGPAERTGAAVAKRAADARSPGARRDHRQGVREAARRAIRLDARNDQSAAGGSVIAMAGGATDGAATWQRCTWRVHVAGLSADSRPRPAGPNDACTSKARDGRRRGRDDRSG